MAFAGAERKYAALIGASHEIWNRRQDILDANCEDLVYAEEKSLSAAMIDRLTLDDGRIYKNSFGLGPLVISRTLEEVGRQFRVTRERIRQIEAKALRKMRHPTRIRQLEGFLEAAEV